MKTNYTQRVEEQYTAAMQYVHRDEASYMQQICAEFAVSNMGQDIRELAGCRNAPATYAMSAWYGLMNACEVDISGEFDFWKKDAKKMIASVKKAKLPFTLENARLAWEKKGPFAKG